MTEHEHDVPPRPAFVLQVRNDANGAPTAWLDDEQITVPPGVGVHRALIRAARRRADRTEPGHTIRVAGMTPDGATFHLGIGPDGDAWEVPPPEADEEPVAAGPAPPDGGPVPDDISHVIELQDLDGRLVGLVDDEEVTLIPGVDPYDQLLRQARRRADEHAPGKTVRVLGRTPGARVWHIALTPDGTPQVVAPVHSQPAPRVERVEPAAPVNAFRPAAPSTPAEEPGPQPAYAPEDDETESRTPPTAALTDDRGRPIPTTTAPATAPHGFGTTPRKTSGTTPTSPTRSRPGKHAATGLHGAPFCSAVPVRWPWSAPRLRGSSRSAPMTTARTNRHPRCPARRCRTAFDRPRACRPATCGRS
ncbi:hypothetical protein [Flexivirga alba]|uniref:Uncharacterized protein n=1 Tax=Flexivirga alba TaxID=702742 RepID=A0ABW2ADN4_9MICO